MKVIGMIVATQREIIPLLEAQHTEIVKENRFGFKVMKFCIADNNIVCVQSGMGEIFAASATQMLISAYGAEVIINFGVCGSLGELSLTESVIVKGVVHYDYDVSDIDNCEVAKYAEFPSVIIPTDENLREMVKRINPSLKEVICASADKFVADEKKKEYLHSTYGADICEMECAGVLITATRAGVPCLIIKAVSDGKGGAAEYEAMVTSAAKSYISIINELAKAFE